jgi:hypothetical protein
MKVLENTFNTP